MSLYWLSVLLLLPAAKECSSKKVQKLPLCIQQRIDAIKKEPRWNPPAEVHEYRYKGKTVYLFSSDCCDQFNTLFDAACKPICAPSGGITGKGDMRCPDFTDSAQHIRLVWKDNR